MMAKSPAVLTQLKAAQARIVELEKKLADESSRTQSARVLAESRGDEIEQVHQVLDAVPNSIARKSDHEESWQRVERSIVTRMAAWLSNCNRN